MELSLSQIISSIGGSVQEARHALEREAVELYFKGGYEEKENCLIPITKTVSLPNTLNSQSAKRELNIPITALFSHKTISLNTVDVKLHLTPCSQNGDMLFKMAGECQNSDNGGEYVDLSLSFGIDNTPEGMARLNQENIKLL